MDPTLIFGLDTKLFSGLEDEKEQSLVKGDHNEEVQTLTIYRGHSESKPQHSHQHSHQHGHGCECASPARTLTSNDDSHGLEEELLIEALNVLPKESIWRVKGFIRFSSGETKILNWAFGRYELTPYASDEQQAVPSVKVTVMGQRGEMKRFAQRFADKLSAELSK